jgi:hypothetical protein
LPANEFDARRHSGPASAAHGPAATVPRDTHGTLSARSLCLGRLPVRASAKCWCRPQDHHQPLFQPQPGRGPQAGDPPQAKEPRHAGCGPQTVGAPQAGPTPQAGPAPQAKELPHPGRLHPGRNTRRGPTAANRRRGPTATNRRGPARHTMRPREPRTQRACWIFEVWPTISLAFGTMPFGIAEAAVEVRATPPSAAKATIAIFSLMEYHLR